MMFPLQVLRTYAPWFLRRRGLEHLFSVTASAFGRKVPAGGGLTFEHRLEQYAKFTNDECGKSITGADRCKLRNALFQSGLAMGGEFRRFFRISTDREAKEAMRAMYRILGIDLHIAASGRLSVGRCFFSSFYSPLTCSVISAIDEGVFAGLSGGGTLKFTRRITEGFDTCSAETRPGGGPG